MMNETTELLEKPCSEEQAREVREVFGSVESPTIYQWVLAGLAKKAHDGNASAAKELRVMVEDAKKKEKQQALGALDYDGWGLVSFE